MPAASKPLPALEQRLVDRLLEFERLDEAWPRGRTAIERAEIGRLDDRFRRDAGAVSMMVIPSSSAWMVLGRDLGLLAGVESVGQQLFQHALDRQFRRFDRRRRPGPSRLSRPTRASLREGRPMRFRQPAARRPSSWRRALTTCRNFRAKLR